MTRPLRADTASLINHVVIRGVNKNLVFLDVEDRRMFLRILRALTYELSVNVFAYCLMGNHVHLILHDPKSHLSLFMQRLQISYVRYFNEKYEHEGTLFQHRFRSEAIEDVEYLWAAIRYVLLNPEKAGIAPFHSYQWSSYRDFANFEQRNYTGITAVYFVEDFIADIKKLVEGISDEGSHDIEFLDAWPKHASDDEVVALVKKLANVASPLDVTSLPKQRRNGILLELLKRRISSKQIERVTGVSKATLYRLKTK